jgi:hypothetical protein
MAKAEHAWLLPYLQIIQDFLDHHIDTLELQRLYHGLDPERPHDADIDGADYRAWNEFFLDIEDYVENPALRRPEDFDEAELRRRAERARGELRALLAETGDLPEHKAGPPR